MSKMKNNHTTSCDEESHPLSTSDSSLVGTWFYDTTFSSEERGISAMSMQFDIKQNSWYAIFLLGAPQADNENENCIENRIIRIIPKKKQRQSSRRCDPMPYLSG